MADILHDFPIKASAQRVFQGISTPNDLDAWWTKRSSGEAKDGAAYTLWFGPEYDWRAIVSRCIPNKEFELTMTVADKDWTATRVGFFLTENNGITQVRFYHVGWPESNEHYRISSFCWAMYLRLLKLYLETGLVVQYEDRLDV